MNSIYNDNLDKDRLKDIASYESDLCLTLTMGCAKGGIEAVRKNRIDFKNLVSNADETLERLGWKWLERRKFLRQLLRLRKDEEFWDGHGRGLMVLCDDKGFFEAFQMPFPLENNVVVDRRFYLRPVIPHFQENILFAVIVLNRDDTQIVFGDLLHEDYYAARPSGPLTSFDEYLSHFEFEKSLQFVSKNVRGTSVFFGHGVAGDKAQDNARLSDYFRHLENWIVTELRKVNPDRIYYAADDRAEGSYLKVVRAHHPEMERLAHINTASSDPSKFAKLAAERIVNEREMRRQASIGEYRKRIRQDRKTVSAGIREVSLAAHDKRVEKLLLPASTRDKEWGHIREQSHDIEMNVPDGEGGEIGDELINLAVIETFLNGGEIIPLNDSDHMRVGAIPQYAALCRW